MADDPNGSQAPRDGRPPRVRHTFGSLLLADGVPIKHVSEQMGHANVAMTLNVYQHVLRSTSATATRQLDKHIPAGAAVIGSG